MVLSSAPKSAMGLLYFLDAGINSICSCCTHSAFLSALDRLHDMHAVLQKQCLKGFGFPAEGGADSVACIFYPDRVGGCPVLLQGTLGLGIECTLMTGMNESTGAVR
jgi:hypothetical protein